MYLYQALPWKLISNYLCIHFVRYAISTCICTTLSQLATSKLEFLLVIGFNICSMLYTQSLELKIKFGIFPASIYVVWYCFCWVQSLCNMEALHLIPEKIDFIAHVTYGSVI